MVVTPFTGESVVVSRDEVRVFPVPLDRPPVAAEELLDCLTADELARADRYGVARARQQFVVGRGVLRRLLGGCLGVAPGEVPIASTGVGKPVLAAVNGVAAGGGLSLAMAGDLVLAAESARFTMAYSRIAASPDGSSTYWLPRLVGLRRAVELFYTNRVLSAREAMEWGLVSRVVPDGELASATRALATELAQGPTLAFGRGKLLLHGATTESLETQMELESQWIAASGHTEDFAEGVRAFVAKRAPSFKGR